MTFPVSNEARNRENYPCAQIRHGFRPGDKGHGAAARRARARPGEMKRQKRDILFANSRLPRVMPDRRASVRDKGAAMAELAHVLSEAPQFDAAFRATFAELLAWRRDVRHFRPEEAPDEATLAELFDLAALAPSVGNCQPTRFVRVDDEARRASIGPISRPPTATRSRPMRRTGGALRQAQARGLERRADPACGLLRRGDGAGPWPRRAHHARDAPLFDRLRAAYVLARRARPRPRRRLGLDPRSGTIAEALDVPRAWTFIAYLCVGFPREEHLIPELERAGWQAREAHPVLRR